MILRSAKVLGLHPRTVDFPANFIGLSKLWVAAISQTSPRLVYSLLASLKHSLVARDNPLLRELRKTAIPFEQSVRESVDDRGRPVDDREPGQRQGNRLSLRKACRVRSVQRMPLPAGWDAQQVADAYSQWLTRTSGSVIEVVQSSDGTLRFLWRWPRVSLLELHPSALTRGQQFRRVFYIRGVLLTRSQDLPHGRFEFRVVDEGCAVLAAIHEYAPRLPWRLYQLTQAQIHLLVMHAFASHLGNLRALGAAPP
jgi:hypothetical protein